MGKTKFLLLEVDAFSLAECDTLPVKYMSPDILVRSKYNSMSMTAMRMLAGNGHKDQGHKSISAI